MKMVYSSIIMPVVLNFFFCKNEGSILDNRAFKKSLHYVIDLNQQLFSSTLLLKLENSV